MRRDSDDRSFSPVVIANDDYEMLKAKDCSARLTVAIIEKRHGLKPGQLRSYRANNLSRKGMLFCNGPRPGNLSTK